MQNNSQYCKWFATKAQNNRTKCPSHEKESNEKREKGKRMADDISTGQLILVADYQRILKERGNLFGCVSERRSFHTDIDCLTKFSENLNEWTSITSPSAVECIGLTNKEIDYLQKQFTTINFKKESTQLQVHQSSDSGSVSNQGPFVEPRKKAPNTKKDWIDEGNLIELWGLIYNNFNYRHRV